MRRQLIPFPRMKPLKPSSLHMRTRLDQTPLYCLLEEGGWTCLEANSEWPVNNCREDSRFDTYWMIFNLSNGLTTVRDAAPAMPPAMKYEESCGLNQVPTGFFVSGSDILTEWEDASTLSSARRAGALVWGDVMTREASV